MAHRPARSMIAGVLLAVLVGAAAPARPATERLVVITESVGFEIDPAEREAYGLFVDYRGFLLAEVVDTAGRLSWRISYASGKDRLVDQVALTEADLQALRSRIEARDEAIRTGARRPAATAKEKEGRLRMVTDGLLYGLGLYGPGTMVLLDVGGNAASGIELLVAGGAFAGALNMTQDYRLGYARGRLLRWGNYAGTFYGFAIPALLDADNERVYVASAMAVTPLGGYLAHRLSASRRFGKGEADLIPTGGLVGMLYGVAVPYLIDVSDLSGSAERRVYLGAAMAGLPVGATITTRLTRDRSINRGRAHLITLGGFLGVADALTTVNVFDDGEHPRFYVTAAMIGLPAGAYLGYRLTEAEDYTLARGRMISVGAYAGGLVGNGLLYSMGVDDDRALSVSGMVGSMLGVWFTHRASSGWGKEVTRPSAPAAGAVAVWTIDPGSMLTAGMLARHGGVPPVDLVRVTF